MESDHCSRLIRAEYYHYTIGTIPATRIELVSSRLQLGVLAIRRCKVNAPSGILTHVDWPKTSGPCTLDDRSEVRMQDLRLLFQGHNLVNYLHIRIQTMRMVGVEPTKPLQQSVLSAPRYPIRYTLYAYSWICTNTAAMAGVLSAVGFLIPYTRDDRCWTCTSVAHLGMESKSIGFNCFPNLPMG